MSIQIINLILRDLRRLKNYMNTLYCIQNYIQQTISEDAPLDESYKKKQGKHIALVEERIQIFTEIFRSLELKLYEYASLVTADLLNEHTVENVNIRPSNEELLEYENTLKSRKMQIKELGLIIRHARLAKNYVDRLYTQKKFFEATVYSDNPLYKSCKDNHEKNIALLEERIKIFTDMFHNLDLKLDAAKLLMDKDILSKEILEGIDTELLNEQVYEDLKKDPTLNKLEK